MKSSEKVLRQLTHKTTYRLLKICLKLILPSIDSHVFAFNQQLLLKLLIIEVHLHTSQKIKQRIQNV